MPGSLAQAKKRWGDRTQAVWRCCFDRKKCTVRVCKSPDSPNFGRSYVICHPKTPGGIAKHKLFFRWCNFLREDLDGNDNDGNDNDITASDDNDITTSDGDNHTVGALPNMAARRRPRPRPTRRARGGQATFPTSSGSSTSDSSRPVKATKAMCALETCLFKVAQLCAHGLCITHCAFVGGCDLHTPLADDLFSILVYMRFDSDDARPTLPAGPYEFTSQAVAPSDSQAVASSTVDVSARSCGNNLSNIPSIQLSPSEDDEWDGFSQAIEASLMDAYPGLKHARRESTSHNSGRTRAKSLRTVSSGSTTRRALECLERSHAPCEECHFSSDEEGDELYQEILVQHARAAWRSSDDLRPSSSQASTSSSQASKSSRDIIDLTLVDNFDKPNVKIVDTGSSNDVIDLTLDNFDERKVKIDDTGVIDLTEDDQDEPVPA
ncbi:hypothetical protein C8Q80DRAFT_1265674 [Daedaleopsis nitida]|nr:hypothetical protein C8Q80DRAFT_1265674 [Daedaleopsis nitida]